MRRQEESAATIFESVAREQPESRLDDRGIRKLTAKRKQALRSHHAWDNLGRYVATNGQIRSPSRFGPSGHIPLSAQVRPAGDSRLERITALAQAVTSQARPRGMTRGYRRTYINAECI